jgi:hypothetical protein
VEWFRSRDARIHVIEVEDPDSPGTSEARQAVRDRLDGDEWVVTSRADSDDMLHREHFSGVRSVHRNVRPPSCGANRSRETRSGAS